MKFLLNTVRPNAGATRTSSRAASRDRAVALVITLLMLSVITFLAIAFLSMTSRDKTAVTASLDLDTAKTMSDAALARAQASAIAQMMSAGDILSYDLAVSTNYISPNPYAKDEYYDPANVNYDTIMTNNLGDEDKAWNIADLFWDPRPPVFIQTNGSIPNPQYDFRFWVDINRNGGFETNGSVHPFQDLNLLGQLGALDYYQGEPEWIGVLKYPETNHGPNNPFIGRYAYMILPIGKTLDWNFIHNYSRNIGSYFQNAAPPVDSYIRDQGVGSWELNLGAFLDDLNTNMYNQPFASASYFYNPALGQGTFNGGDCFNDAVEIIRYRYDGNPGGSYPLSFPASIGTFLGSIPASEITNIDEFAAAPSTVSPFDPVGPPIPRTKPWPGSYNTNMFYDVQDVFDSTKTGLGVVNPNNTFAARFAEIMTNKDTYDRYTMQRMMSCIGVGSQPEYGVYVYSNAFLITNGGDGNPLVPPPTSLLQPPLLLRTKVNINFDNSGQIAAGPNSPMPTNLTYWASPQNFFTNAADLLLRSQIFVYTNFVFITNGNTVQTVQSNYTLETFGITNIPVYSATNPGIVYNEQVHRMLQLAANIYAAVNPAYVNNEPVPPVFRPQYSVTMGGNGLPLTITITNFVQETAATERTQVLLGDYDFTNASAIVVRNPNVNYWGVPWVIGAVKGLPAFDQFSYQNQVTTSRRLNFVRAVGGSPGPYNASVPPQYTNQFFCLGLSNIYGLDAWNPYAEAYYGSGSPQGPTIYAYYDSTITVTNNYNWGTNIFISNTTGLNGTNFNSSSWPGYAFKTILPTNFAGLPVSYFSQSASAFLNVNTMSDYLPADKMQKSYPTYYWSVSVSNHLYYALFDGPLPTANLIDYVNLGSFGSIFPLTQYLLNYDTFSQQPYIPSVWTVSPATPQGTAQVPQGVLSQILNIPKVSTQIYNSILGNPGGLPSTQQSFDAPVPGVPYGAQSLTVPPYANYYDSNAWAACDPLVHYTIDDLVVPWPQTRTNSIYGPFQPASIPPLALSLGKVNSRYAAWVGANGQAGECNQGLYIFGDTSMTNSDAWRFPAGPFPSIGWLGRVHRGTPWQTVYLKPDDPVHGPAWSNAMVGSYGRWVNSPYTYPTNDYRLLDLFTAVPNDNAARGLLSVNNTNDAAWAAVFAGVIAPSNETVAGILDPTNVFAINASINALRPLYANGNFRNVADIVRAPALTVGSPFLTGTPIAQLTDDVLERIPQQTLGLLKVGYPQFVIYSWGQALRPKAVYSGGPSGLTGICTNYEITGEFLTRTICHVVSTDGTANSPQIVVDNYNIMPGN